MQFSLITSAVRSFSISSRSFLLTLSEPFRRLHRSTATLIAKSRKEIFFSALNNLFINGTVVFPNADLKIFLTADAEERAKRRYRERLARGEKADYGEILKYVNERDLYDMNREIAPLRPAAGCVILDSTRMTIEEVTDVIVSLVRELGDTKEN